MLHLDSLQTKGRVFPFLVLSFVFESFLCFREDCFSTFPKERWWRIFFCLFCLCLHHGKKLIVCKRMRNGMTGPFLVFSLMFSLLVATKNLFSVPSFRLFFLRAKIANNSATDFVESCLNLVRIEFRSLKFAYFFPQRVFHSVLPLLLPRRENERRTCF